LKVLDYMIEQGDDDELRKTIQPQGRQTRALPGAAYSGAAALAC
jgi:hypothetical protein